LEWPVSALTALSRLGAALPSMTPFGSLIPQKPSVSTVPCGGRRPLAGAVGWILGSEERTAFPPYGSIGEQPAWRGGRAGILLAMRLRERNPTVAITETHPKALLIARKLDRGPWSRIAGEFKLQGKRPSDLHQRDALLGAVVAREGIRKMAGPVTRSQSG
jgi:hypothetical protein